MSDSPADPAHHRLKLPPQKFVRKIEKRRSAGAVEPGYLSQYNAVAGVGVFWTAGMIGWPEATKRVYLSDAYFHPPP